MTTKIRFCGDSIGAGYPFYTGPRARLARAMGGSVSWIGTLDTEWVPGSGYTRVPGTTLRHEAHGGIDIGAFTANYRTWFRATSVKEDVALILLGVNDYAKHTAREIVDLLRDLVAEIQSAKTDTEIVVMPPTPAATIGQLSREIERLLSIEVPGWNAPTRGPVSTAPLTLFRAAFEHHWQDVLISDGTHLSRYGDELLADDLTIALGRPPLPRETPPPTIAVSSEIPTPGKVETGARIVSPATGAWDLHGPLAWDAAPDDAIYITTADGDHFLPTLDAYGKKVFEERVRRWQPLAEEFSRKYSFPTAWTLGVIYAESGGEQDKKNDEKPPGLGLMQITAPDLKKGHTDQEFLDDPRLNVETGVKVLSALLHLFGRKLPDIASGYNAGFDPTAKTPHPSDDPLWRMRNTPGHIGRVVQAANTALGYPPAAAGAAPPTEDSSPSSTSGGLAAAAFAIVSAGTLLVARRMVRR